MTAEIVELSTAVIDRRYRETALALYFESSRSGPGTGLA
jgi:hypothetical protein